MKLCAPKYGTERCEFAMRADKRKQDNLPLIWQKAERLAEGIYRLHFPNGRYRYGFVFPDGTHATLSSEHPLSLKDLRLIYRAEAKAKEMRQRMEEGKFDLKELERTQQRRWQELRDLGLLLEQEDDEAFLDD
jgi:hypothetical protein